MQIPTCSILIWPFAGRRQSWADLWRRLRTGAAMQNPGVMSWRRSWRVMSPLPHSRCNDFYLL